MNTAPIEARQQSNPAQKPLPTNEVTKPTSTQFVHVEKNLASLGFFTPSTKKIKGAKKKIILFNREVDGKNAELRAVILPSAEYGLPVTSDQDKYLALQKIITEIRQRFGVVTNPIGFTSAQLLRILGLKVQAGKNYDEIVDWAKRMTLTGICSEGVVYFAGKKTWASDTFHVFERFVSYGKEMPDGATADRNYVWLSDWQLENINHNFLFPIDFEDYKRLKNHIAKALVPLFQIWLYATRAGGCFEKRYDDLCQILNIRQYPQLSRIKEKLEPSLQELVAHGYLSKWLIRQTSNGAGYKIAFYHGEKFLRDQKNRLAQKEKSPPTQRTTREAIAEPTDLPVDVDQELLAEMVRRGISEKTSRELLNGLAIGQQIMDQLEWGDYQIRQAPRGKFYNPSGLYIRLIRENIKPPENFESSRKRQLREAADRAWHQEQEEKARLELVYIEYRDQTVERYIQKNYSKEFYASSVRAKKLELLAQDKRLRETWNDETLTRVAERRLRQDIAVRIPLLTMEEFRNQQKGRRSEQELLPGFVSAQSLRT
ncbi:MAG: replication initiator protein A [Acidobacteria bacterium]|nr:replication initiator protein A [Acidobacteriota bacterium]